MRELQNILNAWQCLQKSGEKAVLATVVKVEGSAYRRVGARMLVAADGRTWGGVSGGCLEADVVLRAQTAMQENCTSVACYDTRDDADIFFGLGLGCNGVIQILIEPLPDKAPLMDCFAHFLRSREAVVLATVFRSRDANFPVGTRWFGDEIEKALISDEIEVFHEILQPSPTLVIFGAGHDALPVTSGAKALGWHVIVADHRPQCVTAQYFPDADEVLLGGAQETFEKLSFSPRTGVLLMTHNYLHDRELLPLLLGSSAPYIGLLGSHHRTQKLLGDLKKRGLSLSDNQKMRLHAPVGLDIGAQTPEEIALAILAEMQAMFAGRPGGFLRDQNAALQSSHD